MKVKTASAISLLLIVCLIGVVYLSTGPSAVDFCLGTNKHEISQVKLKGQMRQAILTDPMALAYLKTLTRYDTVPEKAHRTNVLTFILTLSDNWGRKGKMAAFVNTDGRLIEFMYAKENFGTPSHVFIVIDANAPLRVKEMLAFLADETNRGKEWKDGVIQNY